MPNSFDSNYLVNLTNKCNYLSTQQKTMRLTRLSLVFLVLVQFRAMGQEYPMPKIRFGEEKDITVKKNNEVFEITYTKSDTVYVFQAIKIIIVDTTRFFHTFPKSYWLDSLDLINFRQIGTSNIRDSLIAYIPNGSCKVYGPTNKPIIVGKMAALKPTKSPIYITTNSWIDNVPMWIENRETVKYYNHVKRNLPSYLKTGYWSFYYPSGNVMEQGQYTIKTSRDTCTMSNSSKTGIKYITTKYEAVRTGTWKKYYDNEKRK